MYIDRFIKSRGIAYNIYNKASSKRKIARIPVNYRRILIEKWKVITIYSCLNACDSNSKSYQRQYVFHACESFIQLHQLYRILCLSDFNFYAFFFFNESDIFIRLYTDRQGLKGTVEIGRLRQAILRALRMELDHRTTGGKNVTSVDPQLQQQQQLHQQQQNQVCDALIQKIPLLR